MRTPGRVASESLAPDHPMLTVIPLGGRSNTKISYKLLGLSPRVDFRVYNKDLKATVRAVKERLFYVKRNGQFQPPPSPLTQQFDRVGGKFRKNFKSYVQYAAPYSQEQFLATFDSRRRALYEKAFESLRGLRFSKTLAKVKFFVKCEKTNFTAKSDPVPRGISPRDIKYNCLLGPFVKRIEKQICKIVSKVFGTRTIFKGLNASSSGEHLRAHWDHFCDPVAIPLDASRFDQHVSKQALQYEHSFYKMFYHGRELSELTALLKLQEVNHGVSYLPDGIIKFVLDGGRMSGDMNTGLGNCLLMCAMMYSYMDHLGMSTAQYRLANNGDDCVLIVERNVHRRVVNKIPDFFLTLGFEMEVGAPVDVFEKIEFCQTQPVWAGDGWMMMRQFPVSLAKDCLSLKPLDNVKVFKRWCASIGDCGMALTGGMPIAQEFYTALKRVAGGAKPLVGDMTLESGFARLAVGMNRRYKHVTNETRVSFWRAFDIPPDRQIAYEQLYRDSGVHFPPVPDYMETYGMPY